MTTAAGRLAARLLNNIPPAAWPEVVSATFGGEKGRTTMAGDKAGIITVSPLRWRRGPLTQAHPNADAAWVDMYARLGDSLSAIQLPSSRLANGTLGAADLKELRSQADHFGRRLAFWRLRSEGPGGGTDDGMGRLN